MKNVLARIAPPLPALALLAAAALASCAAPRGASFATPEQAVQRLLAAADDEDAAEELLGPGGFALLRSGDDVADRQDVEAVVALAGEGIVFEDLRPDAKLALLGRDRWELPIPLVREAGAWRFDVEAGREEVLNRRVGRNELSTIATLREIVAAQREYASQGHDGSAPQYAPRLLSSPGKHDGLYWPTSEGEPRSPLGALVAEAFAEGYRDAEQGPIPYHGYFFRLLTHQGPHAPGGARSYVGRDGRLSAGFAVVAWPATYDNSGVMTFLVNHQGLVFQKDLGPHGAASIQSYDPDETWTPTAD